MSLPLSRRTFATHALSAGIATAFALPAKSRAHPSHVTLAQLHHRPTRSKIEGSLRIDSEDLEQALRHHAGRPGLRLEDPSCDRAIRRYLQAHVILEPHRELPSSLHFVGKDLGVPHTWLLFELQSGPSLSGYRLTNSLLVSLVPNQINTVHLYRDGYQQTLSFRRGQTSCVI